MNICALLKTFVYCSALLLLTLAFSATIKGQNNRSTKEVKNKIQASFPEPGSYFVMTYYFIDSLGHLVPKDQAPGNYPDDTLHLLSDDAKFLTKSNVFVFTNHRDTTYVVHEPNGDMSLYNTAKANRGWDRLPFGAQKGMIYKSPMDSMVRNGAVLTQYAESQVVGEDTVRIGDEVLKCTILSMTSRVEYAQSSTRSGTPYESTVTYWYSPRLGYLARMMFPAEDKFVVQAVKRFYLK